MLSSRGDVEVQGAYATAIDDLELNGSVEVLGPRPNGDYAHKVNHAYRTSTHPFLFLGADDLEFHHGWWTSARACLELDTSVGVLGTNDLAPTDRAQAGDHSTHSVVRRSYADLGLIDGTPGILYEGYVHEYVDDELVGTAKKRGAWLYDVNSVVEHLHPHWGKGPTDALYRQSQRRMVRSRALFNYRRRMWT